VIYNSTKHYQVGGYAVSALALLLLPAVSLAQLAPSYTISTIAGQGGVRGSSGNGGTALGAELGGPFAILIDATGNLLISDQFNNQIRQVSSGQITAVVGSGSQGYAGDGGSAATAELNSPSGLALDSKGNIYIADTGNFVVREVTSGSIKTFAGSNSAGQGYSGNGGPATSAQLVAPTSVAVDSGGNLYITDPGNSVVQVVCANTTPFPCGGTTAGTIETFAGYQPSGPGYNGDGSLANSSMVQLDDPNGVAVDSEGNVYIADTGNSVIRKVTLDGVISTIAGNGTVGYTGDGGSALSATLDSPKGVAVDSIGNLYISDTDNSVIRVVTPNGNIQTIAGNGTPAFAGDGGPAIGAELQFPSNVVISNGLIYVADTGNDVIRLLTPVVTPPAINAKGVITAGSFGASGSVAPGSWVEIYGTGLAEDTRGWTLADFTGGGTIAPTNLDGTTVTVGGQNAYIDYISPTQVNVQVPLNVAAGTQPLVLTTPEGTNTYSLTVNASSAGLYAPTVTNIGGQQYVGALYPDSGTWVLPTGAVSTLTSQPAAPGDIIVMYGVGFGPVSPAVPAGEIVPGQNTVAGSLQIFIGGMPATFQYDGLAPNEIGLYQFNVTVPNVAPGNAVPVTFMLNGVAGTQTLYTAIGAASTSQPRTAKQRAH
jgi:uncharacterized protein (TIGR03437 family)